MLKLKQPEVGGLIKELRLHTGLTQEQFATDLGVTYSTINRWENSSRIRAIANVVCQKVIKSFENIAYA
jgi:DNA-binding transcriptional regulator YiaG